MRRARIPAGTETAQPLSAERIAPGQRGQGQEEWQSTSLEDRIGGARRLRRCRLAPVKNSQDHCMRILAITNIYPSPAFPASGVFVKEQVKGLRSIGLEVRVLFVDRRQEGPLTYYRLRDKIGRAVADFEPDVIHVMYGGVMADQIVRRHHVRPVVVTFHGSDLLGENLSGLARKIVSRYGVYCSRRAAKSAEAVVVVARHLGKVLNGVASAGKVRVI